MWKLSLEPFEIAVCRKGAIAPLSYWVDDEFPEQTYLYRIVLQDRQDEILREFDLTKVRFLSRAGELQSGMLALGGRSLRALWEHRRELDDTFWRHATAPGVNFAQCTFPGLQLRNPHEALCQFYLRRTQSGDVCWGITPFEYSWGVRFPALYYLP